MREVLFEWDEKKNAENFTKHGVTFATAEQAFFDEKRVVAVDLDHSKEGESRHFCMGKVRDEVLTVRFTYREDRIRIFGAGYWRKGRRAYEDKNQIH